MLDASVSRDKNREPRRLCFAEQRAVLQTSPRLLLYCANVVPG
ncbi:MAG TPA: hypothetical protein VFB63_20190 [Bryobacteraceae bacterium]|jgi:hypothetical protein|nr:hypothetical protein [Bryobacteraceae bacterium]